MQEAFRNVVAEVKTHPLSRRSLLRGLISASAANLLPSSLTTEAATTLCNFDAPGGAFSVDNQLVGGSKGNWWNLEDAQGNPNPNSFKFAGTRHVDTHLPGWDMQVPSGMVMDAWIDHNGQQATYRIMGGESAQICHDFEIMEATLYTKPGDAWDILHENQWMRVDGAQNSGWQMVGTAINEANQGHTSISETNVPTTTICDLSGWDGITTSVDSGYGRHYNGGLRDLSISSDEKANYWDISTKQAVWADGPTDIYTSTATIYCK